ncbi:MAG: tetratricopeptide repeat protein [Deltaproteobacteria bacterium]|nr:tetratricopeptide repeat protein [Deltaproteobacteria bacterium]
MKEFFKRQGIDLEVKDVARYARVLIDDLSAVLNCEDFRVHLLETTDQKDDLTKAQKLALTEKKLFFEEASQQLHLPVIYNGQPLAVLSAVLPGSFELPEKFQPLLMAIIKQSLDKLLLYIINITDRETGLYNEDYFRAYLKRELKSLSGRGTGRNFPRPLSFGGEGDYPGLTLLLVEIAEFSDLTSTYGRIEANRALRAVAQKLGKTASPSDCVVRLSSGRLGLVMPRRDLEAGIELAKTVQKMPSSYENQELPQMRLGFGLASYPLDFTDEYGQAETVTGDDGDLAEALSIKAELALRLALTNEEGPIFTFGKILKKGGRVIQVLPLNRIVVNLGWAVGARVGQVFSLNEVSAGNEATFKGEVILSEVEENFAVGQMTNLLDPLSRVKAGDALALSQSAREDRSASLKEEGERLDPLLRIPDHFGFVKQLDDQMEGQEKFAIMLIRVDGYDSYRQTMGRILSDQQMKGLYDLLQKDMPEKAVAGRFSADCLAILCPGLDEASADALAEAWLEQVNNRHAQTVSFGLAAYPCGIFTPVDTLTNAQKALEHASFFGPGSKVAFDSVSLNISGDKLFESGDLEEAIAEYEKALKLNPNDLNVLNSLGVCYGHQHNLDRALECFQRVLKLEPQNLMAHFNQGFALSMAGRKEEALESFRRAVEIDEQNFDALFQLGMIALGLERVDEAVESFERAERIKDSSPVVYKYLGKSLLQTGRNDEAIKAFKAAVRIDPRDADSMSQLGVLFMDKGTDLEVALSLTKQSVELDQSSALFRERLARALHAVGDLAEGEAQYRLALEMGAQSRELHHYLGQIIKEQGRLDEAAECYKRALALDPEYRPASQALQEVGELLLARGGEPQAET